MLSFAVLNPGGSFPKSNIRAHVPLPDDLNQNANVNPDDPMVNGGICMYCAEEATNPRAALPTRLSVVLTPGLLYSVASKACPPIPRFDTLFPE